MTIEEARKNYKDAYIDIKGVIGVCSKYKTVVTNDGIMPCETYEEWIMVYVENVYVIDKLPKFFDGFRCEYIVCHGGYDCGCD